MIEILKRNGTRAKFEEDKIIVAIEKSMADVGKVNKELSQKITAQIKSEVESSDSLWTVEGISDRVEQLLMEYKSYAVAKAYILYRNDRAKEREVDTPTYKNLSKEFLNKYKHAQSPMSQLGNFVYYRTYSRWLPEKQRREFWWETCARAVDYNCSIVATSKVEAEALFDNMFNLRQFLSGRTMWVGNTKVSELYPMSNFNCSFEIIEDIESFVDLFYLLMLGSGVGVRINKDDVKKLPYFRNNYKMIHKDFVAVPKANRADHTSLIFDGDSTVNIIIGDSKNGWVDALKYFLSITTEMQYKDVRNIIMTYDNVRPAGEKLKTFGGTASGHNALKDVFTKIDNVISRKGNLINWKVKLEPIDCLDICNIIGEGVVVGGVRRTAEIALFDSDDEICINAKSDLYKQIGDQWVVDNSLVHRSMSNNSIFYKSKPTREKLHWLMDKQRYSGEPGFVNSAAASKRRDNFQGINPCAEILLDNKGMCNLTTVNVMSFVRADGTLDRMGLLKAQKLSARSGYRMTCVELELPKWNNIQQRDKLIGCSLTGWQDMVNATGFDKDDEICLLRDLREVAVSAAAEYAKSLRMEKPLLVTTIKPEGTLSQLPVVSSGVHYSHSPYYIRRIRVNAQDPIVKVCEELGYPIKAEVGQDYATAKTKVVEFPVKSPEGRTKYDVSAIEQLENYLMFMEHYIDHNCSITVHVRDEEWETVEQWMWDNWDNVVAVSFLSLDDSFYELLPYESISHVEYDLMVDSMKPFNASLIAKYEKDEIEIEFSEDPTCTTGSCPVR